MTIHWKQRADIVKGNSMEKIYLEYEFEGYVLMYKHVRWYVSLRPQYAGGYYVYLRKESETSGKLLTECADYTCHYKDRESALYGAKARIASRSE